MDRRLGRLFLGLALLVLSTGGALSAPLEAPDLGLLKEQNRIKEESEMRIQRDILDPILGKGVAMPFVDVQMEVKLEDEQSTRSGMGLAQKYREKLAANKQRGLQSMEVMPGIPKPKTISGGDNDKPEAAQAQQASQLKGIQEERFAVNPVFKRMSVTIIHDDTVLKSKDQIDLVRSRILEVMKPYGLTDDNVFFRPTQFKKVNIDWRDDLKRPEVYLPLLFALLTLLFLLFLFGPLWRFFRQYVQAIKEKPAAEVNVDSKIMPPEKQYDEKGQLIKEESKIEMILQRKAPEPPPPPPEDEDEDEMAKKFEPFAYINEENVKRLAYMFVLRKEEPWIVAVAASYLRPDLARQMLAALPIEMQARVAIEALTVRQVTREQVIAIDADVKENVDFVVGGMERLTAMLDEADTATRNNILNYLKNEKPLVYEHVRKVILTFDDVVGFPDRDMQVIVRELKTEAMAKALQEASPEVVKKFLSNMSAGAASLLKESMEYVTGLTPAQIDEERAKIMDLVKALEKEGKIVIRNKADLGGGFIEGMQEELGAADSRQKRFAAARRKADAFNNPSPSASAAATPQASSPTPEEKAQAQQYFAAGVQYHDAQQFEGALQYLQTAIQLDSSLIQAYQYMGNCFYSLGRVAEAVASFEKVLETNPDPQLRQWVEGLKAQAR